MERRKQFLLFQGDITVGDNLTSYQETVCATNVCVAKPNDFFTKIVELLNHCGVPRRGYLLLGISIQNCRISREGGENGLQDSRIKQWRPEWVKDLSISHISWYLRTWFCTKEIHLLLTTKLAICGYWLPSVSTGAFRNWELSPRNFLTFRANGDSLPFSTAPHLYCTSSLVKEMPPVAFCPLGMGNPYKEVN